jgi:hypothetical protein
MPQPFPGAGAGDGPEGYPAAGPVTIDMGGDPLAASLGTPDPVTAFGRDDPPPPPAGFGLDDDDPAPTRFEHLPAPPPQLDEVLSAAPGTLADADPEAISTAPGEADEPPSTPPVRRSRRKRAIPPPPPVDGDPAEVGIRPRTPTRIPAAGAASGEAKAMLDRIAALRSRPD